MWMWVENIITFDEEGTEGWEGPELKTQFYNHTVCIKYIAQIHICESSIFIITKLIRKYFRIHMTFWKKAL